MRSDFLKNRTTDEVKQLRKAAARAQAIHNSGERLLPYIQFTMPSPDADDDAAKSQYVVTPQARLLCTLMEKVEAFVTDKKAPRNPEFEAFLEGMGWPPDRPLSRVCVSIGPQMGKTEIISKRFPAWFSGRNPYKHVILGQYNSNLAEESGGEVRAIIRSENHRAVFPRHEMRIGSESKSLLVTDKGGKLAFVGVGGTGSGKPSDLFIIDDPIKNDEEAQSEAYRNRAYQWFTKVSFARLLNRSAIVIVHTRWSEDDIIGRLCDPDHPDHDPKIASRWLYINLPAVVEDPALANVLGLKLATSDDEDVVDQFGAGPIAALSPSRKDLPFLAEARRLDPRGYDSLYDGKPSPDDGTYFTSDTLIEYEQDELPSRLRLYGASDHALGEKEANDETVAGCFGIDDLGNPWILPDVYIGKSEADKMVEEMVLQMRIHQPLIWWAEDEHIRKSIGPFLTKRMIEEDVFTVVQPVPSTKDLKSRARPFQGMCALGRVRFPKHARWWPRMKQQLLRFPYGTHDDFVSFCSLIGRGLLKEIPAERARKEVEAYRVGSIGWVKAQANAEKQRVEARDGW